MPKANQPPEGRLPQGFWREKVEALSKWDVVLIVLVVSLGVGWLLLNLEPIEQGDPVNHWDRVSRLLAGGALNVADHHDARFAIDVPVLVVRLLLGDHANLYYVAPLTAFAVLVGTTYRLGGRVFDRRVGLAAGVLLILFPQSLRSGSQLLPGGFEATFVALSAYFVLTSTGSHRDFGRPILASIFLFLGYLAKVQVLFYAPGLVVALWLVSRSRRAAVSFTLVLAGLGAGETLLYILAPWDASTRLTAVNGGIQDTPELGTFFDLFDRYRALPDYWLWVLIIAVLGAVLIWGMLELHRRAFLMIPGSFLFVMTFAVRSLQPLKPLVHFPVRYLTSVIPFLLLFFAFLVFLSSDSIENKLEDRSRVVAMVATLLVGVVSFAWFVWIMDPISSGARNRMGRHPLALNAETYMTVSEAIDQGRSVVISFDLHEQSAKEIRDHDKSIRYLAVFFFPFDSDYRVACFADSDTQIALFAPTATFDGAADVRSRRITDAGDVVLVDPYPDARWWQYGISQTDWTDVEGGGLLDSEQSRVRTLSMRETGDWGLAGHLCR